MYIPVGGKDCPKTVVLSWRRGLIGIHVKNTEKTLVYKGFMYITYLLTMCQ
jgi:hypothetical protein